MFAVHISDNILQFPWLVAGFLVAGLLAVAGAWRIREEEIPRVAILTSAFFVASLVHVRLGPTSVHLLLNGLVGVLLGWRAALAIPVGLFLQAILFGHGGLSALGVNCCVMGLPALLSGLVFDALRRSQVERSASIRAALVGLCTLLWLLALVFSVTLLFTHQRRPVVLTAAEATEIVGSMAQPMGPWSVISSRLNRPANSFNIDLAQAMTFHPLTLLLALGLSAMAAWLERRPGHAPEFTLGLLIGVLSVLATVTLNFLVLRQAGAANWTYPALIHFVVYLPLAAIEGLVLGFTVSFLARVKPEMLGPTSAAETPRPAPPPTAPARD